MSEKQFYSAEDFISDKTHVRIAPVNAKWVADIANEKLDTYCIRVGKYRITDYPQESVWIYKDDGEGMAINEATMDKIWKENF